MLSTLERELLHRARMAVQEGAERCGFVGLSSREVRDDWQWRLFDMRNAYEGEGLHYRMDVQEQLQRFAELQASGVRLWGVFHTHTVSNKPSANDEAAWKYPPNLHMVICTPHNNAVWTFDGEEMVPSSWED